MAVSIIVGNVRVDSLYTTREVLHMKDVKGLVEGVYRIQGFAGVYLLVFTVTGLSVWRHRFVPSLARYMAMGGGVTHHRAASDAMALLSGGAITER